MIRNRLLLISIPLILILSFSCCAKTEFEHPISVSAGSEGAMTVIILDYENDLILELLNNGKWVNDIANCGYDYVFEFGAHNVLRYHSECGTFIDIENTCSLTVSEGDRVKINDSLSDLIQTPNVIG